MIVNTNINMKGPLKTKEGKHEHRIIQLSHQHHLSVFLLSADDKLRKACRGEKKINKTTERMRIEIVLPAGSWDEVKGY